MHPLMKLAIYWAAVFVAVVAAKKTRLTLVLFFLFMGFALVNLGIVPHETDSSFSNVQNAVLPLEAFYTLMITAFFLNIAVPITIRWWRLHYMAAEAQATAAQAAAAAPH